MIPGRWAVNKAVVFTSAVLTKTTPLVLTHLDPTPANMYHHVSLYEQCSFPPDDHKIARATETLLRAC